MSPRWGVTIIYHDRRPSWHSFNQSEHNARGFFDSMPEAPKFTLILWRRENGERATVAIKAHRANLLRIVE